MTNYFELAKRILAPIRGHREFCKKCKQRIEREDADVCLDCQFENVSVK